MQTTHILAAGAVVILAHLVAILFLAYLPEKERQKRTRPDFSDVENLPAETTATRGWEPGVEFERLDNHPKVTNAIEKSEIKTVEAGRYIGKIVAMDNEFVTQDQGRGALVRHRIATFDSLPTIGEVYDITCKNGRAIFKTRDPNSLDRGR